jgi:hypothetical protein
MLDISEIPTLPNRDQRLEELFTDCYGQIEELAAFEVYFTDALAFPFKATWRDPDESGHAESVEVVGVHGQDERRGILLTVQRGNQKRRVVADQLWANDTESANAIVLDDYRHWVNQMDGLTPGYEF